MSLSVRDATPADYDVFVRLFPALEVPDPVLTAAQFEAQMLPNVAIAEDGEPIGYVHWRFYGATLHVVHVVVDAGARRRGVGRLLLDEVRRRAVAGHAARWYLNVKANNGPAIRLYERAGLALEQRGWSMVAEWDALRSLPGPTETLMPEPSEEAVSRFARDHGIEAHRLALVRGRPGVVFVALRDQAQTCALAVFDPAFPGIYPVAVARPEHARPLIEALFPYARHPRVAAFVEGNASLAQALRDRGATLQFEILRMGASLT
jgi:GNAT superfamily N-acetyltransferase